MGLYDKIDRFLPFDRFLDPMFGGGAQAPRMVPQRSMMGPGVGGEMPQARMQAGPARPEKKVPKVSKLRVLDRVLGGQTFSEALDYERARPMQEERSRQLAEIAQQVITDPREWMVFQSDPEAWAKENATRYGAATMGQGTTRVYGDPSAGGSAYTAPTYDFQGDQAVQYGPEGFSILGTRNPTFDEQTGRQNADTGRMNAERPMAVSDGSEVIDPRTGAVVYRNTKTFAPPRIGGGRAGGALAGAPAMSAVEAELRRRGLIK